MVASLRLNPPSRNHTSNNSVFLAPLARPRPGSSIRGPGAMTPDDSGPFQGSSRRHAAGFGSSQLRAAAASRSSRQVSISFADPLSIMTACCQACSCSRKFPTYVTFWRKTPAHCHDRKNQCLRSNIQPQATHQFMFATFHVNKP